MTPIGEIVMWVPEIPVRSTLDKMRFMVRQPKYVLDQPTERLPQSRANAPRDLREFIRKDRVFYDVSKLGLPEGSEEYAKFRTQGTPLMEVGQDTTAEDIRCAIGTHRTMLR